MSETRTAKLFFLTEPEPERFIVNFQVGESLVRLEISLGQLVNCITDGAAMLGRHCAGRIPLG